MQWEAFGTNFVAHGPTPASAPPFRFPGQYHDAETGLAYNKFRYYDATTASYVARDPLFLFAGPNHYTYPRNPLSHIDPEGLLDLTFECKNTPKFRWTPCRKWAAEQRVRAMNRALENRSLRKCKTHCRDKVGTKGKQREYYNTKCGGKAPATHDVDHFVELQTGGADKCCANLVAMPSKLNQVGMKTAIGNMLKSVNKMIPKGTRIAMKGCWAGTSARLRNARG